MYSHDSAFDTAATSESAKDRQEAEIIHGSFQSRTRAPSSNPVRRHYERRLTGNPLRCTQLIHARGAAKGIHGAFPPLALSALVVDGALLATTATRAVSASAAKRKGGAGNAAWNSGASVSRARNSAASCYDAASFRHPRRPLRAAPLWRRE